MFLSTNFKNGTLLSYEVLENPFHETHCRLRKGFVLNRACDWPPHRTRRRLTNLAYGGPRRLLFLHTWDYVKGFYEWLSFVILLWNPLTNLRKFTNIFHYLRKCLALTKGLWARVYFTKAYLWTLLKYCLMPILIMWPFLETPLHKTHHRLIGVLHQTKHVITLHRGHLIYLWRVLLVAYSGSQLF